MVPYKARRKQSKYKQILKNEFNIDGSEEPSKNLMIGNAGLVSGVMYEQIAELFTQFGNVEKIIMIPRKSYSFVVFSKLEDAEKAFKNINGQVKLSNMDGPMHLIYSLTVPPMYNEPELKSLPEGLTLIKNFVTEEEEAKLLNCINWDAISQETGKSLKHRRVKHFGYEFRYDNNNVDKDSPLSDHIPQECGFITDRLASLGHRLEWIPNQLTVNQYQKGQGIPSHIDTHSAFESPLLSLSLESDVVMDFRRETHHVPVTLPRRSLLIMDGEARYAWTHGITPRSSDVITVDGGLSVRERSCRTSFTLRRVREKPCRCQFPTYCDSQSSSLSSSIPDHEASRLEELYVHKVYNKIAGHFSETRTKVWPNVKTFLQSFPTGSVLVDAGCGNGKYFGVNPNIFQVGFDRSVGLAEITGNRGHEVFVGDCLSLPLQDNKVDGVISVAVLHHLSTQDRRLKAVQEIYRVLAPGGLALISVWAKDQTRQDKTAYLKQDRKNRKNVQNSVKDGEGEMFLNDSRPLSTCETCDIVKSSKTYTSVVDLRKTNDTFKEDSVDFKLPIHAARTEFQHQDVFVPWKMKSKNPDENVQAVFLRYYHVFEENELYTLCSSIKDILVLETYYTEGNWCLIFQKPKT